MPPPRSKPEPECSTAAGSSPATMSTTAASTANIEVSDEDDGFVLGPPVLLHLPAGESSSPSPTATAAVEERKGMTTYDDGGHRPKLKLEEQPPPLQLPSGHTIGVRPDDDDDVIQEDEVDGKGAKVETTTAVELTAARLAREEREAKYLTGFKLATVLCVGHLPLPDACLPLSRSSGGS